MMQPFSLSLDVVWPPRVLPSARQSLSPRERQVVSLASLGHANKVIASELGLAVSTVSVYLVKAARKLGVRGRVAVITVYRSELDPDEALPSVLSRSEREIAVLMLQGASNSEIAASRMKSERTIANQVASIFRKLGVGSRSELAARYSARRHARS